MTQHTSSTRRYAVYSGSEKVGYVTAADRKKAKAEAVVQFGPGSYFVASATR